MPAPLASRLWLVVELNGFSVISLFITPNVLLAAAQEITSTHAKPLN
jgi:hypothetical protein